jgi:aconitate decarboxylase
LKNGKVFEEQVDWPKGSGKNPMSAEERFAKFEALSAKVLNDSQRKKIAETVDRLEKLKSIRELTSLLGPH